MGTLGERLDRAKSGRWDFQAPDEVRFAALALSKGALAAGGARPAVLIAANEVAVAAFLSGRIGFLDIAAVVADALACYDPPAPDDMDGVLNIDLEARAHAEQEDPRLKRREKSVGEAAQPGLSLTVALSALVIVLPGSVTHIRTFMRCRALCGTGGSFSL